MHLIEIWNIKFNLLSKTEIVNVVQAWISEGHKGIHLTGVNPETVVDAQKYPQLRNAINGSDIVNVDNMFVALSLRLLGYKVPERAATPDVFELLLKTASEKGQSIYILGAEQDVLDRAIQSIKKSYPRINIVGWQDGFYAVENESAIVEHIASLSPTYLFIALPSPRKETFILNYKSSLNANVCYGVGGAIDVRGGRVQRAPAWACRIGLEGFFRVLQNPKNYGKRITKYYPSFVKLVIKEMINK